MEKRDVMEVVKGAEVLGIVEDEIRFQRSKKTPNSLVNKVGEESGVMEVLKTGWKG